MHLQWWEWGTERIVVKLLIIRGWRRSDDTAPQGSQHGPFSPSRKELLDLKSHSIILVFISPFRVQLIDQGTRGDCEGDRKWPLWGSQLMFVQLHSVRDVWEARASPMMTQREFWGQHHSLAEGRDCRLLSPSGMACQHPQRWKI